MTTGEHIPAAANPENPTPAQEVDPELLREAHEAVWAIKTVPETQGTTGLLLAAEKAAPYMDYIVQGDSDGTGIQIYRGEDVRQMMETGTKPEPVKIFPSDTGFLTNRRGLYGVFDGLLNDAVNGQGRIVDPLAAEKAAVAEKVAAEQAAAAQKRAEEEAARAKEQQAKLDAAGPKLAQLLADNGLVLRILEDGYHGVAHAGGGKPVLELENLKPETSLRALAALAMLGFKESED